MYSYQLSVNSNYGKRARLFTVHYSLFTEKNGGLAQLARASALHAEGQRFESVILHKIIDFAEKEEEKKRVLLSTITSSLSTELKKIFDMMEKQAEVVCRTNVRAILCM